MKKSWELSREFESLKTLKKKKSYGQPLLNLLSTLAVKKLKKRKKMMFYKKKMLCFPLLILFFCFIFSSSVYSFSCSSCGNAPCPCYNASGQVVGSVYEECQWQHCFWYEYDCELNNNNAGIGNDCNTNFPTACNGQCTGNSNNCGSCSSSGNCDQNCYDRCLTGDCNNCELTPGGCDSCFIACSDGCGGGCYTTLDEKNKVKKSKPRRSKER